MAIVVEVVRTPQASPINTSSVVSVVEVASRPVVANAVVSATPPPNPYEGMVWIDIS
jgi:hypothetical protein